MHNVDNVIGLSRFAGPGGWNDPGKTQTWVVTLPPLRATKHLTATFTSQICSRWGTAA